jgi:regulatory protein
LDEPSLRALALHYVGRYATTRLRLHRYLQRKVAERGWADQAASEPVVAALIADCERLGYVDDREFARSKQRAMQQRALGQRRVEQALYHAGICTADRQAAAPAPDPAQALALAVDFARRRRLGPFAREAQEAAGESPALEPKERDKALRKMLAAGHSIALARLVIDADAQEIAERLASGLDSAR